MKLEDCNIGFAITGSFCTFDKIKPVIAELSTKCKSVIPIFSFHTQTMDQRFGTAKEFVESVERITNHTGIKTIQEAEPIGPKGYLDLLVVAPCTGNTMAKLCNGITDTPVLMACKAHLRNEKPLLLSISSNDNLGINFKNIGLLMNMKHIYFVPFGQDDVKKKPNSMVADVSQIPVAMEAALEHKQLQPLLFTAKA